MSTNIKDINAIININAIKNNIDFFKKKSGTDIMAVIKGNGYGHGLIEMSKIVRRFDIKHIGVATLGEAIILRKNGDIGRILGWLYDIEGDEIIESFKLDIDIAIFDDKTVKKFISLIPKNKKIKVTIFIDTGINRTGIPYDKAIETCKEIKKCSKIEIVGLMSHLVCSEIKNSSIVKDQLNKFRKLRKELEDIGIKPQLVHIADTGACLNYNVSDFTLARIGIGLFGMTKNLKIIKELKFSITIKSYIIQIKELQKGVGVGYSWKYITPKKMQICILPIGYADIIPRNTSFKLNVYINNTKRKVLGLISMDQIVVESRKEDKINDEVYIFGDGQNCIQTIYDLCKLSNSTPSEILSHIGYRINRIYL